MVQSQKDNYYFSRGQVDKLLSVLHDNWFLDGEDGDYNNDDVIALTEEIKAECERQDAESDNGNT